MRLVLSMTPGVADCSPLTEEGDSRQVCCPKVVIFLAVTVTVSLEESFLIQNDSQELCQEPKHKTKKQNKTKQTKNHNRNPPASQEAQRQDEGLVRAFVVFACAGHTRGPVPAAMPARALSMLPPLGTEDEAPGRVISRIGTHPSAGTRS